MPTLENRVIAVTGAARGIGRATAIALARRGARVAIGDIDHELAAATAREIGNGVIGLPLDVTRRASFAVFLDEVEQQLGPLDALINNAGIAHAGAVCDESDEIARRVMDINVHGVILGCKLALARMQPRNRGHIVNVASLVGRVAFGGVATYCASKHAVVGFTNALIDELRDTTIQISCVMPSSVNTDLIKGLPNPRFMKHIQPEDVAEAIADTLLRPRRHVHVPGSAVVLGAAAWLPPGMRRLMDRLMGMERGMLGVDPAARRAYEARIAGSVGDAPKAP